MNPVQKVVDAIIFSGCNARGAGSGHMAQCPAHDDRKESLSISEGESGQALLHCHAGCAVSDIVAAIGLEMSDLFVSRPKRMVDVVYRYEYEDGEHAFDVVRLVPKGFLQRQPGAGDNDKWSTAGIRKVPYRLPSIIEASKRGETIWIVEGEKDVHAIERAGGIATCNPGGALKWKKEFGEFLSGAARCIVIADKDQGSDTGARHADQVALSVSRFVDDVRIIVAPGDENKDAFDFLSRGGALEALVEIADRSEKYGVLQPEIPVAMPVRADPATPKSKRDDAPKLGERDEDSRIDGGRTYETLVRIIQSERFRTICIKGGLEYNAMSRCIEVARKPIDDVDVNRIRCKIESSFWLSMGEDKNGNARCVEAAYSKVDVFDAIQQVAYDNQYNPVKEYLDTITAWDNIKRMDFFAEECLGSANATGLEKKMIRAWFISAVARALKPGCKVDTALILVGAQGAKKTSAFSALADPWCISFGGRFNDRDAKQIFHKHWIVEWGELESMKSKRDFNAVKDFLSCQEDAWVAKYERIVTSAPRAFVVVGTTNEEAFLDDPTGSRRFWPVRVGAISIERIREWRDQLWAEAVEALRAGEDWWLGSADEEELQSANRMYEHVDSWTDRVLAYCEEVFCGRVEDTDEVTIEGILSTPEPLGLGIDLGRVSRQDQMRVSAILRRAGMASARPRSGGSRHRQWLPVSGDVGRGGRGCH